MPAYIDLSGKRLGRWTVIRHAGRHQNGGAQFLCRCDCGGEKVVCAYTLRSGQSKSCGCLHRDAARAIRTSHGKSKSRTYRSWMNMHRRCRDTRGNNFKYYAASGIAVCRQWRWFEQFLEDMGERPHGMTLDRVDGTKGYAPGNCRWTTHREQQRNTRSCRWVTFNGKRQLLSDWARELGMDNGTLRYRLNNWPVERALTERV